MRTFLLLAVVAAGVRATTEMAGFFARTDVSNDNNLDQDQYAIQMAVGTKSNAGMTAAGAHYTDGGAALPLTIEGFATTTAATMWSCAGCPYQIYKLFYEYYGAHDYADKITKAAISGASISFSGKQSLTFPLNDDPTFYRRSEFLKKSTAYMTLWMRTVRQFEHAKSLCTSGSGDYNLDALHEFEKGVAYWVGSREGTIPGGNRKPDCSMYCSEGANIFALAEKRCYDFATCGADMNSRYGTANVNLELFNLFFEAQNTLYTRQCGQMDELLTKIFKQMMIPLVQGTMRYGHRLAHYGPMGKNSVSASGFAKQEAEGAMFFATIAPLYYNCSAADTQTIWNNINFGKAATIDIDAFRAAMERNYKCLGITCKQVGAFKMQDFTGGSWVEDKVVAACTDESEVVATGELPLYAIIIIAACGALAILFFLCICLFYKKEKAGKPIFRPAGAVSGTA